MYLLAFLSFKFGWVANNTFFCGVTILEHTLNLDFTETLIYFLIKIAFWSISLHHFFQMS